MTVHDEDTIQAPPAPVAEPVEAPAPVAEAPKRRRGAGCIFLPVLVILLLAGGYVGYNYLQDQQRYVSTENAW